jgi:heterodisulfide reductase subunit A-like polyferredoxin
MPLSRRALLSALFPSASGNGEATSRADQQQHPALVATLSTSNICVERHGVACRRCAEVCDHSAIRILAREGRGAVINAAACTGCGDCAPVCPVEAIAIAPRERVELVSEVARLVAGHG